MDDRNARRPWNLIRGYQADRLHKQALAGAYECIVPIHRRKLPEPALQPDERRPGSRSRSSAPLSPGDPSLSHYLPRRTGA